MVSSNAQSPNVIPDLRRSAALPDKDLWQQIDHDGVLEANAMVGWAANLTRDEIDLIRGYVSSQADKLKVLGDPAPVRPAPRGPARGRAVAIEAEAQRSLMCRRTTSAR